MAKRHKKHEEHINESWLLPYADLVTLLLAVFVVLFAANASTLDNVADFWRNTLGVNPVVNPVLDGGTGIMDFPDHPGTTGTPGPEGIDGEDLSLSAQLNMDEEDLINLEALKEELDLFLEEEDLGESIITQIDERGLVITLNNSILFASGRADLQNEKIDTLVTIGEIIRPLDNYIRIEGHTDDRPISTAVFPSNWELSGARSASVLRLLSERAGINPSKMAVVGFGESRPIADNATPEGRALNRRVDIVLLNRRYSSMERQPEIVG